MDEEVEKMLKDAESSVLCETTEVTSVETLERMKKQLLGLSNESDDSFIYGLVKNVNSIEELDGGKRK